MKILLFLSCFFIIPTAFAFDYEIVQQNDEIVYSPAFLQWSLACAQKGDIILKKSDTAYTVNLEEINLNSKLHFLYLGRLIGFDSSNLRYYEIFYNNNSFIEIPLSYEDVEEIFFDVEVLKISDFHNGMYTIINHGEDNKILLYNDTEHNFSGYVISPKIYCANANSLGVIKLPDRGKIIFSHSENKTKPVYKIRVR